MSFRRSVFALALVCASAGCDQRTETECQVALEHPSLQLELSDGGGEPFILPTDAIRIPEREGFFYVTEQIGTVWELDQPMGARRLVLDLTDEVSSFEENWELGMYAIALHPSFPAEPRAYVSYTAGSGGQIRSRVVEYRVGTDGAWDANSRRVLFAVRQPNPVHNGGTIRFLPDGRLGLALGDGDEGERSQEPNDPLGKFLAIDVESGRYEILAVGLRNPWRWSVSPNDGQVFIGDVGHLDREELNRLVQPGNYGWPRYQGLEPDRGEPFCDNCGPLQPPVVEYCRSEGNTIVAGLIYRGDEIPALRDQFLYGDFGKGFLFVLAPDAQPTSGPTIVGQGLRGVTVFFEDHNNEVLALSRSSGQLLRLQTVDRTFDPPSSLSESDFVDPDDPRLPPTDALEYSVSYPFYSDGAGKNRWWIPDPDGSSIEVASDGRLQPGTGGALVKYFELNGTPVETRVYTHNHDGKWRGYSYRWRDDGSNADLLLEGESRSVAGVNWVYPSRADCDSCHTDVAGPLLGFSLAQLSDESIERLQDTGRLSDTLPETLRLVQAGGEGIDAETDARTYLHVNCASCHQPGGGGGGSLDMRIETVEAESGLCAPPQVDSFDIVDARIIAAGDVDRSVLWRRVTATEAINMNPFRQTRDVDGERILREWIANGACDESSP